ncbi:unnamed protein product [Moneuplotes crassus]|uniref:Uncharacterized protein n=1 Tax=Euplotes crassus TaxID=5936 RepID=A0AAD1XLB2_EUPCR|nr:unnamed protein product [Moneuplotes crassus]
MSRHPPKLGTNSGVSVQPICTPELFYSANLVSSSTRRKNLRAQFPKRENDLEEVTREKKSYPKKRFISCILEIKIMMESIQIRDGYNKMGFFGLKRRFFKGSKAILSLVNLLKL